MSTLSLRIGSGVSNTSKGLISVNNIPGLANQNKLPKAIELDGLGANRGPFTALSDS